MTATTTKQIRVLHVDDDPDFADVVGTYLEREDDRISVQTAEKASDALDLLAETTYDCIVSDYDMPGRNGIEFLSAVRENFPDLPFILFTGKGSEEVASRAISEGVSDYLQKQPGTERYELLATRIVNHVERTKAQRELKEREQELQLFREAVEAAGHCIYWTDRDGILQYVNPAFEDTTGYTAEEAIGRNPRILKSGEHGEAFYERMWGTILSGETWRSEVINSTKAGEQYVVDQTIAPVTSDSGEITHFVAVNADITEQKRREEQLREERDRREALFQNPGDAIIEIEFDDETPLIQAANETFQELFGYDTDTVVGDPVSQVLVPEEDEARNRHDNIKQRVLDGEVINTEVRRQTRQGPRQFHLRVFPIDIIDGHRGSYAVYSDITERVEREHARIDTVQYERLRALFENAQSAIVEYVYVDGEPIVQDVNRRFEEIFGYDREAVVGSSIDEVVVPPEKTDEATRLNEQVARGQPLRAEVDRRTDDGLRSFVLRNAPIRTEGEVRGYTVYTDITDRKQRERELEATKQRLEQSNEKLEQFAGVVSHDLRNPINVIRGHVENIRNSDDGAADEHIEAIDRSVTRMEDIVEDLLALSRAGEDLDELQPVSLASVVKDSWATVDLAGTEIDVCVPEDATILADRDRLLHVFENLFRNARDHNDPPLTIRVGTLDISGTDETDGDLPGFFVEDDGAGIPESERAEVFEHGYTTNTAGTGFGLSIVAEIVEAHGWTVSVDESVSGGARFEVHTTGQS